MTDKPFKFAEFEDPNRCSFCRETISELDQTNGLVLHVTVAPHKSLNPETGEFVGWLQPEGPKNRYLHARPCGELYAQTKLVCLKCNYWVAAKNGSGLCLCVCHPPRKATECAFLDNDLERAGGQ